MLPQEPCRECGQLVGVVERRCPYCDARRPTARQGVVERPETQGITRTDLKRGGFFVLGLLVAVWFLIIALDPEGAQREESDRMATVNFSQGCEDAVESLLVQPHTADFPFAMSNDVQLQEDGSGILRSHVEAMNLMGATIRRTFTCYGERGADGEWDVGAALDPLAP